MREYRTVDDSRIQEYLKKVNAPLLKIHERLCCMMVCILRDKFGYGYVRVKRATEKIEQLKNNNIDEEISAAEMTAYLLDNGIDINKWTRSIPQQHKYQIALSSKKRNQIYPETKAMVDSVIIACMLLTCCTLKEEMKMPSKKINEFLEWMAYYIDSYARNYVNDKSLRDQICEDKRLEELLFTPVPREERK